MTQFGNFDVVSFVNPHTKTRQVGFVVVDSKPGGPSQARIYFDNASFFGTNGRFTASRMFERFKCEKADHESLPAHTKAIFERAKRGFKFKKGMVVSVHDESETVKGRVVKGGQGDIRVAIAPNEIIEISSWFVDEQPLPRFDSPLDDYQVDGYRIVNGHDDSTPYVAKILHKGKVIAHASDDGWGGGGCIDPDPKAPAKAFDQFIALIDQEVAVASNNREFYSSMTDMWVYWDWYFRPTGQSFRQYIEEFCKELPPRK